MRIAFTYSLSLSTLYPSLPRYRRRARDLAAMPAPLRWRRTGLTLKRIRGFFALAIFESQSIDRPSRVWPSSHIAAATSPRTALPSSLPHRSRPLHTAQPPRWRRRRRPPLRRSRSSSPSSRPSTTEQHTRRDSWSSAVSSEKENLLAHHSSVAATRCRCCRCCLRSQCDQADAPILQGEQSASDHAHAAGTNAC